MSVEELEVDELPLLLEELVVLGNVLHQDVVGQVNRSLNVAVTRQVLVSLSCNQISVYVFNVVSFLEPINSPHDRDTVQCTHYKPGIWAPSLVYSHILGQTPGWSLKI